jgi:hypothetical protein
VRPDVGLRAKNGSEAVVDEIKGNLIEDKGGEMDLLGKVLVAVLLMVAVYRILTREG